MLVVSVVVENISEHDFSGEVNCISHHLKLLLRCFLLCHGEHPADIFKLCKDVKNNQNPFEIYSDYRRQMIMDSY